MGGGSVSCSTKISHRPSTKSENSVKRRSRLKDEREGSPRPEPSDVVTSRQRDVDLDVSSSETELVPSSVQGIVVGDLVRLLSRKEGRKRRKLTIEAYQIGS